MQHVTCTRGGLFWVLTEGAAGMRNQAVGLAEAMGAREIIEHHTRVWGVCRWLCPYVCVGHHTVSVSHPPSSMYISPPLKRPEALIACGRKSIGAAIRLRKNMNIPLVYIQNPYISLRHFDATVVSEHDNVCDARAISMVGSCHRINPQILKRARIQFAHMLGKCQTPRYILLVGGPNRCFTMPKALIERVVQRLEQQAGTLWVSVSRRTPKPVVDMLKLHLGERLITPNDTPNPYIGLLAWSDICMITCDSTSMISEVISAEKPTYLIQLPGRSRKFQRFYQSLEDRGLIRWWKENQEILPYTQPLFREMKRVAQCVRQRLEQRRQEGIYHSNVPHV